MILQRALGWLGRTLVALAVVALVALAVLISIGRYYLQYIEQHREAVLHQINASSGLQLRATALAGSWRRFSPQLVAADFSLGHPHQPGVNVMQAQSVSLRLDLIDSILALAPRIAEFEASDVVLRLQEGSLGRWYLQGFAAGGGDSGEALDVLLAIGRAELSDVRLILHFANGDITDLNSPALRLTRSGDFRRLKLTVQPEQGEPLDLVVEAHGDPRRIDQMNARGYVRFVDIDLKSWLPLIPSLKGRLSDGRIDGEIWLQWQGLREFSVEGRVAVPMLDLAGLSGQPLVPLEQLALNFRFLAQERDWQLWIPSLAAQWGAQPLQLHKLHVTREGESFQAGLRRLPLEPWLSALKDSGLLGEHAAEALADLHPRGELERVQLDWSQGEPPRLRAEFSELQLEAWHGAPGARGGSGYLEAGPRDGVVHVASQGLELAFPLIYDQPLAIDRIRGAVRWRLQGERVRVDSGPLRGSADMGQVGGHFSLDLPLHADAEAPPLMTLMVGLRDSQAQYRDRLLPHFLDQTLLDWLKTSVGSARLPASGFLYRGSLRHDDDDERTVQLFFQVRDGELDYQPPWPELRDIDAQVLIDDEEARIDVAKAATLGQTAIEHAVVEVDAKAGRLVVGANVASADDDVLAVLTESPLQEQLGTVLQGWHWRGQATAELSLNLPLRHDAGKPVIVVDAKLASGQLRLEPAANLIVENVQGPLNYSSSGGLTSPGLTGRIFGHALKARIDRQHEVQRIHLDTRLTVKNLQQWLGLPEQIDQRVEGQSRVKARVDITTDGPQLFAQTDLTGVRVHLPAPFAKSEAESWPLRLSMPLTDHGLSQLNIDERLALQWARDGSAVVALGGIDMPDFSPGVIRVSADLPQISFTAWREVLESFSGAQAGISFPVELQSLRIAEISLLGQALHNLSVSGSRHEGVWRLRLDGDELAGELAAPSPSGGALALWLSRLDLTSEGGTAAVTELDPSAVPEVDFAVGSLRLNGDWLGGIRFRLLPLKDGLRLDELGGSLRDISISGSPGQLGARLDWRGGEHGFYSTFRGRLLSGDLADVLSAFGYERAVTSERGRLDAKLRWPGRPDEMALTALTGQVDLAIDNGSFVKVSDSASGALKVVGIFNFANLTRRLRLDFSDIFSSGISFDQVEGRFTLDRGVVTTVAPLVIESPASKFRASGQVDFNTDQVDMELVATLPIASNLPWVAALASGLPAAAGVFIVSKMFEKQMDRYSSAVYRVEGSWNDPDIEFQRIFSDRTDDDVARSKATPGEANVDPANSRSADGVGKGAERESETGATTD